MGNVNVSNLNTAVQKSNHANKFDHLGLVHITEQDFDLFIDLKYAQTDNFTGQIIYQHDQCFLHPNAAKALLKAVEVAKDLGFKIKVFDAFRPQSAQERLWQVCPNPDYVADPKIGSNHTRAVAIDLTLINPENGTELDMGTGFDTMDARSHHFYLGLPQAQMQVNRMCLLTVMLTAGFVHHPREWWHYQLPNANNYDLVAAEI
jgi:D-alanyl-D-alanine dipeptidase